LIDREGNAKAGTFPQETPIERRPGAVSLKLVVS